jgi:large subunit ribosomal protein L24
MKLKKGDNVKVVLGKDKGKTGKIEKVFSKTGKVVIAGVNEFKRHLKARTQGQKSEIVTVTKPLALQNVALICPSCKLPTRIGYKMDKPTGGDKIRFCRKCSKKI